MKEEGEIMNFAIILAGGISSRMNSNIPKQYIKINDKPIIMYSLETFQKNSQIDRIIIVAKDQYHETIKSYCSKYGITKLDNVISSGSSRQNSVNNALSYLKEKEISEDDIVLIHDSARPLVSQKIIDDNISECMKTGSVVTAVSVNDTIFISDGCKVDAPLERSKLKASQTPQTFTFKIILDAYEKNLDESVTDDVQMVLKNGISVSIVDGDKNNFKITTDNDILLLKNILDSSK